MKFVTIDKNGSYDLGVRTEDQIINITAALTRFPPGNKIPQTVAEVIEGGVETVPILREYISRLLVTSEVPEDIFLDESQVKFGPCVTHPGKIICVGLNYREHAEETNAAIPAYPILFNKFNNTLTGHGADVILPKVSKEVDYEAELVIVMGKRAKDVPNEKAFDYVFGYSNVNDLSARDLQFRTNQWLLGKSCDGFSPLGPYLVTADEVGNPNQLNIRCIINGEVRQNSNTSDMIFTCDEIISYISQHMTLEPGDLILTGTPPGVVLGYPKDRRVYLKDGDVVTIEIEKLGALTNRMLAEERLVT